MSRLVTGGLGLSVLIAVYLFYLASRETALSLSPQGCRMSWMSPSYISQTNFNSSWTPLANLYSLLLYREVGWQSDRISGTGLPVLFIPGNAGSPRQIRSIASSAVLQLYEHPGKVAHAFQDTGVRELDFFAVDFNEGLSFYGATLETEIAYSSRAISYILSLYPRNTSIIVMGHSMGGVVATSLLPSKDISVIITLSTPHLLPPVRFDARIDKLYSANAQTLLSDPTPILSLCGGASDMTFPSETCALPETGVDPKVYRRTVFTTALEGTWAGVGHQVMVWCHQVRWRVARTALELGAVASDVERAAVLDKWLRGWQMAPPSASEQNVTILSDLSSYDVLPHSVPLVLRSPRESRAYLVPASASKGDTHAESKFTLFASRGSVGSVGPYHPSSLRVKVSICRSGSSGTSIRCSHLQPSTLKLIPNPLHLQESFPPHEGFDESDGVVLFEADVQVVEDEQAWVGVEVDGADGSGWVFGGFNRISILENHASTLGSLPQGIHIPFSAEANAHSFHNEIYLPNLLSSAIIVYALTAAISSSQCSESLLSPLLVHHSEDGEAHFFPLLPFGSSHRILLHTHSAGPFLPSTRHTLIGGFRLTIYSSGSAGCPSPVESLHIRVDWWSTLGRCAGRYFTALPVWGVAVTALIVFEAWRVKSKGGPMPSVSQSLSTFATGTLPKLSLAALLLSFCPLPEYYLLGNRGEPFFAPIAPILLFLSAGLVCISWGFLCLLMWPLIRLGGALSGSRPRQTSVSNRSILSIAVISLLVSLFLPWQVVFLAYWLKHLYTCATSAWRITPRATSFQVARPSECLNGNPVEKESAFKRIHCCMIEKHHHDTHVLLFMTWLLTLAAPALAVWARMATTTGLTTRLSGDHSFLDVAPFLVLVDFASWSTSPALEPQKFERRFSSSWGMIAVAVMGVTVGSRASYRVTDIANLAVAFIVIVRIGPRYWGKEWRLSKSAVSERLS